MGPPGPGPGPGGGRGVRGAFQEMILMRICLLGVALYYGLASCGVINERPCAYLVLHLCLVVLSPMWYLGFAYFLRDLVRHK